MTYLYIYLAVGIAALAATLMQNSVQKKRDPSPDLSNLLAGVRSEKRGIGETLGEVLVSGLAGLLVVVGWPVFILMLIKQSYLEARRKRIAEEDKFRVRSEDLSERMSVEHIEQLERIVDPLNAVPDLPFGHLNAAWIKYLDARPPDSELWSFETVWTTSYGSVQKMSGYVACNGGNVGPHFITMQRVLEKDEVPQHP